MPPKKEILYPIFLECCQHAVDTYWENVFSELAYGKTPYGTFISKGFLCCRYKGKEFSYKIEKKDPKIIYSEVYDLLTKKLGLLSNSEKLNKKSDFLELEMSIKKTRDNWADIRKKNIKELLIELYVANKKKEYSLSILQAQHLISLIYVAIVFKVITADDITYENGRITHIEGVDFSKGKIYFMRELYDIDTGTSSCDSSEEKIFMSDNWTRYIESLKKSTFS